MDSKLPQLECRRCAVLLSASGTDASPVVYYRCPSCGATAASSDAAALKSIGRRPAEAANTTDHEVLPLRTRLDAFWAHANETDPFAKLGLTPRATLAEARARLDTLVENRDLSADGDAVAELFYAFDRIRDRLATIQPERDPKSRPRQQTDRWPRLSKNR